MAKRRRRIKVVKPVKLPRSVKRLFPQVETVVDAELPVEIDVTAADCETSQRLNPAECAMAQAGRRELHADGVIIGISSSYVIKNKQALRFATPESVRREIVSFDRHKDFAPGMYNLVPKSPSTKLGMNTRYKDKRRRTSADKVVKRKIHHSARVRFLPTGSDR